MGDRDTPNPPKKNDHSAKSTVVPLRCVSETGDPPWRWYSQGISRDRFLRFTLVTNNYWKSMIVCRLMFRFFLDIVQYTIYWGIRVQSDTHYHLR